MRSRRHSRNWTRFPNLGPRRSWESSWRLGSHKGSKVSRDMAVPAGPPILYCEFSLAPVTASQRYHQCCRTGLCMRKRPISMTSAYSWPSRRREHLAPRLAISSCRFPQYCFIICELTCHSVCLRYFDVREWRWLEIFRAHDECGAASEPELKYDRHLRGLCVAARNGVLTPEEREGAAAAELPTPHINLLSTQFNLPPLLHFDLRLIGSALRV
jgi:hypothetical protein